MRSAVGCVELLPELAAGVADALAEVGHALARRDDLADAYKRVLQRMARLERVGEALSHAQAQAWFDTASALQWMAKAIEQCARGLPGGVASSLCESSAALARALECDRRMAGVVPGVELLQRGW